MWGRILVKCKRNNLDLDLYLCPNFAFYVKLNKTQLPFTYYPSSSMCGESVDTKISKIVPVVSES